MTKPGYIVVEKHYEYDDHLYLARDGGTAKIVYTDPQKAREECARLNLAEISQGNFNLNDYVNDALELSSRFYGTNGYTRLSDAVNRTLGIHGYYDVRINELTIDKNIPIDKVTQLFDIFDLLRFYYVQETTIE